MKIARLVGVAWLSIKDVNYFLADIISALKHIPADHPLKSANFVEIALQMLDEDAQLKTEVLLRHFSVRSHYPDNISNGKKTKVHLDPTSEEVETNFKSTRQIFPTMSILAKYPSTPFLTAAAVAPVKPQLPSLSARSSQRSSG